VKTNTTSKSNHYDEVSQYCKDIKSGKILSGIYTKKAIKRFLNDCKRANDSHFPYVLIPSLADEMIDFAEMLRIPDLGGERLKLLPYHKFILYNLFGFVAKQDHTIRRFRNGYAEIARKNSKTTSLLFPIILYDFKTTPAAESFFVSRDLNQAEKSYNELRNIYLESFNVNRNDVTITVGYGIKSKSNSFIKFFSSDAKGTDGFKNSTSVLDEMHSYPNDNILTSFQYGGRARKNNLVLIITSAGTNINGPGYAHNLFSKKVLNGIINDETYFAIIYSYDDEDDWKDPKNFIKANPSLDVIVKRENLEKDLNRAIISPHFQPDFIAKTCGKWQSGTSGWLSMAQWDTTNRNRPVDINDFEGEPCHCGLDLSSNQDFTVFTKCFKRDDEYYFFHRFYIPEDTIQAKYAHENINILEWVQKGIVTATPGPTVDYDFIVKDVAADSKKFRIMEVAFDPAMIWLIKDKLTEAVPDIKLVNYSQGIKNMSPPTKMYEKMALDDKIVDGSPVIRWMIGNCVVQKDVNENYKVLKGDKYGKVDGVITSIMALDRSMANAQPEPTTGATREDFDSFMGTLKTMAGIF